MFRWIPLESNPEVLNAWSKAAGVASNEVEFGDVYGLEDEILALVPAPVQAVLLLFPISESSEAKRKEEDEKIESSAQYPIDPSVFWIKQTISNACGTIGLLHALINSDVTLAAGSPLEKFVEECKAKSPEERAKLLETTSLFAHIHSEAASSGQTAVPTDLDTNLHFTCFVQAPVRGTDSPGKTKRVIELDGRRVGPIDRGESSGNLLHDVAEIVKMIVACSSSVQFSMVSLGPKEL